MATKSLSATAPNENYEDPANWVGGVAPMAGDTVIIAVFPPNGPEIATGSIKDQNIVLSNGGQFFTTETTTLDGSTTVTDDNIGSGDVDIQLSFDVTSAATFINPNYIQIGVQTSATPAPLFTNTGTISYTTNLGGDAISPYLINGFNSTGAVELTNNGTISVASATGANQGLAATTLVTEVEVDSGVNGSGQVDVTGSAPNTTGISTTAPTESVLEFEQDVQGTQTFNINDGKITFDAGSAGTVNFLDGSGILDLPDVTQTQSGLSILGFSTGDEIGLGTLDVTSAAYDANTGHVDLFDGNTVVGSLAIGDATDSYANATFAVTQYPQGMPADLLLPTTGGVSAQSYLTVTAGTSPPPGGGGGGGSTPTPVGPTAGDDNLTGTDNADTVSLLAGNDTYSGGGGNDLIYGNQGNDLVYGNQGDDRIFGGMDQDTAYGGQGQDVIYGNKGDDVVYGNRGDDTLFGGQGNDTVYGGMGDDVLFGNKGDDVLVGGQGADTFGFNPGDTDFRSMIGTGDTVADFVTGTDKIDFTAGPAASAANFGSGSVSGGTFAQLQAAAQTLITGGDAYAFETNGTDGYLFTSAGGPAGTIEDAVKLTGANTTASVKYTDIVGGPATAVA